MKNAKELLKGVLLAGVLMTVMSPAALSQGRLLSGISYAEFRYDSVTTYVEIYASISPGRLIYVPVMGRGSDSVRDYVSVARLVYSLENTAAGSVVELADTIPVRVADTSRIMDAADIVAITHMVSAQAEYDVTVHAYTGDGDNALDSLEFRLPVRRFPADKLDLSDIELCSEIRGNANRVDPYYKNTLHVVPNPKALYGLGMPEVSYYLEIYGLTRAGDSTRYGLSWEITNNINKIVKSRTELKSGHSSAIVEVGSENISDLPSGKYTLSVDVADSATGEVASSRIPFFVYNPYVAQPKIPAERKDLLTGSPFFKMGEEEIDDLFHAASYLATPQQSDLYKKLATVDAKRRFLAEFWEQQDRRAGGDVFNTWEQFRRRFDYANKKYKAAFKAGWLTDRGRVYIEYGPPDDIDRHVSSSNSKPYEIWRYNALQGGVIFVFVDLSGFNNYILVHSTKQGEVDNPDWQKYVPSQ